MLSEVRSVTVHGTIIQAISDFDSIQSGMEYVGLDVGTDPTKTYGEKIKTLKPIIDKVPQLEEQVNELENTISENDADFNNIFDAIVYVGGEPVKEDRDSYPVEIIKLNKGGTEFSNLAYFFYKNARTPADYWVLVTGDVVSMSHMCHGAVFTQGNTYPLDLTGCLTEASIDSCFYESSVEAQGTALIQLKVGKDNVTLKRFMWVDTSALVTNPYNNRFSIEFTEDSDCSGIVNLESAFRNHPFHKLDLSKLSVAKPTNMKYAFKNLVIDEIIVPLDTSEVTDFTGCFHNFNYYHYGTCTVLDLSTWSFKEGCSVLDMFNSSVSLTEIILNTPVFKNSNTGYTFNNCKLVPQLNVTIQDDENMTLQNAHNYTFADCSGLVEIEGDEFILRSSASCLFSGCTSLVTRPAIRLINSGSYRDTFNRAFQNNSSAVEIEVYIEHNNAKMYAEYLCNGCSKLVNLKGNCDLTYVNSLSGIFTGCIALETIDTTGSIGGGISSAQTLDISASPVFNIADYLGKLAINESGYTKTIKLHSTVYSALSDDVIALAAEKNYTLAS